MSKFSLAIVHKDWTVYIALPSPSKEITFWSGHATAAPMATGMPKPIDPPQLLSHVCG